jgi:methylated-DNA-protein-cysteine methyltransferase related protein
VAGSWGELQGVPHLSHSNLLRPFLSWYILPTSLDAESACCDFHLALAEWLKPIDRKVEATSPGGLVPVQCWIDRADSMNWNSVYTLVKQIPRGRVTTYGAIARALKLRGGARTAGRAMAACPSGRGIPWHRVVGAGGRLLLREPNVSLQRKLLESEGLQVVERRIQDFESLEWSFGKPRLA